MNIDDLDQGPGRSLKFLGRGPWQCTVAPLNYFDVTSFLLRAWSRSRADLQKRIGCNNLSLGLPGPGGTPEPPPPVSLITEGTPGPGNPSDNISQTYINTLVSVYQCLSMFIVARVLFTLRERSKFTGGGWGVGSKGGKDFGARKWRGAKFLCVRFRGEAKFWCA